MLNVGKAISFFGKKVILKTKSGKDQYDDKGNVVKASLIESEIIATIQPARGIDLKDMEEGIRNEVEFIMDARSTLESDQSIKIGDDEYRIIKLWPSTLGHYTRAAIGKIK